MMHPNQATMREQDCRPLRAPIWFANWHCQGVSANEKEKFLVCRQVIENTQFFSELIASCKFFSRF